MLYTSRTGGRPARSLSPPPANWAGDFSQTTKDTTMSLSFLLIIVLVLLLIGASPSWGYSRSWGYRPVGGLGIVLIVVIVLLLMGVI
ncbi:uncharacterized protein DUF3309 [Luteibacter rhizovicinus]|uniref:Uncharacterized protein DUF3309 n=2 Tax=Luteibacter rhizovicinus TaxID=242606 RepID=A0A4R3Z0N0_9GAMM|nr:uncharacterized protein DUF3309 [Luteibacter rhizovicinus]